MVVGLRELATPSEGLRYSPVPLGNLEGTSLSISISITTFHASGVSSASKTVRGIPRLKELLGVSKNMKTPSMKIYFKEEIAKDKNRCNDLMNDIRTVRFKDIVTSSKIFFDSEDYDSNIEEDRHFIALYKEFMLVNRATDLSPWLLRVEFDKKKMHQYHVDMLHVHQTLLDFYTEDNVQCMFSDDNADKLVFRIKMVLSDSSPDDMLTELKALEHNIIDNIIIKGIKKVERVSLVKETGLRYSTMEKRFIKQEECMVVTDGTNLREILAMDVVDGARIVTNDINEIYETLGIEAARMALYNEISDVLDLVYVNYRHIILLIDVMTNKGNIMPTDRHGINRGDIGPLAKCSFEETTDKLIKAGIFGEYDKINGVSANIMLGQIAPCGTGDTDILLDESKLRKVMFEIPEEEESLELEELCAEEAFAMPIQLPEVKYMESKKDNELELID